MKKPVVAVGIVLAFGLVTFPVAPSVRASGLHVSRAGGPTFFTRLRNHHHRHALGYIPYGSLVVADFANGEESVADAKFQPSVVRCHHSQATITVPSEDGGERQIRITRC